MSWFTRRVWRQPVHFVRLPVTIAINTEKPPDFTKYDVPTYKRRTAKIIRLPLTKPDIKRQAD